MDQTWVVLEICLQLLVMGDLWEVLEAWVKTKRKCPFKPHQLYTIKNSQIIGVFVIMVYHGQCLFLITRCNNF